jgi:Protein of unknown function (DUF4241)
VRLPTGWLVAADALFEPQFPSFGQTVAPAEVPVCLAIAHLADGDQRIAAAWVGCQDAPVASWRGARVGNELAAEALDGERS